jgi:oxygen-independent coproporphyrinogen-3 oxidase
LPAYEVSNHAKVGAESRHNLNYWRYGDYVGVGPGAHGRISVNETKLATITEPHPENWASSVKKNGHGIITEEILEKNTQADEVLIMGLRLKEGIDVARWENLSGRSFNTAREANLLEQDLIERLGNSRIRCTDSGILVLNSIIAELA